MSRHPHDQPAMRSFLRRLAQRMAGTQPAEPATPQTPPPLSAPPVVAVPVERLETLEGQVYALQQMMQDWQQAEQRRASEPPPTSPAPVLDTSHLETLLQTRLEALEKQISRSGREQFKANSLTETHLERLTAALEMLREQDAHRAAEVEQIQQQVAAAQATARLDVAQALLPALDGIDEALRSGQAVLAQPAAPPPQQTIFGRLRGQAPPDSEVVEGLRKSLQGWLEGLTFVRQRLIDVLEAQDIRPIAAEGQPFDPKLHTVLDVTEPSDEVPPGTVASELRRGYVVGTRVLRHAEVVVAKPGE